jgi:hypothetical protein
MLNIEKYFDEHILASMIIIIIVILLLLEIHKNITHKKERYNNTGFNTSPTLNTTWTSMSNNSKQKNIDTANMVQTGVNSTNSPVDIKPTITSNFANNFSGIDKLVNFKCKINGIEYYLTNIKTKDCKNLDPYPDECSDTIFILMNKSDIDSRLEKYKKELINQEKLCDKTKCNYVINRMFIHDFIVLPVSIGKKDTYYIKGTAEPKKGGNSYPTILNSFLFNEFGKTTLCGDDNVSTLYPQKQFLIETIISNKQDNKINLRFDTQSFINGKDKDGKPTIVPLVDSNGNPKLRTSYIGICENKKCNYEGKDYNRICLYDNQTNPNVIDFEPILIK